MNWKLALSLIALGSTIATPAFAHVGAGAHGGFVAGFMHPIGGLDHVLAMVAVGFFAAQLGGRAVWLVPTAFVTMMVMGGVLGFSGVEIPYVEIGIAASVLVLGVLIALEWKLQTALAIAIVGCFAIFHGHAHGTELPDGSGIVEYSIGFIVATALLHIAGIALGFAIAIIAVGSRVWLPRLLGALTAAAGAALLVSF